MGFRDHAIVHIAASCALGTDGLVLFRLVIKRFKFNAEVVAVKELVCVSLLDLLLVNIKNISTLRII